MSTMTGIAKTKSTTPSATALLRGLRLAAATRLTHATKIARFLIWSGKSAIPNANALGGDMELIDSIHLGGCASGSAAWSRLLRPRTTSRPPTVTLMIRPVVEAALSPPPKRVSPTIPIAAQVVTYPSTRAVALGRGLRDPKNRIVRRSKGGAIEPPMARTMSPGSRSLIDILLAVVPATPASLSQACAQGRGERTTLGSPAKAGSRYSGLITATDKHPTGMAGIRSQWATSTRLGAVSRLAAPRRSRSLLLLREGLTQFVLLLLGQVGRDDLEVILLELVDDLVRRRRPAGQGKQSRGPLCYLLSYLLDEVVADAYVGHRTRPYGRADRSAKEGHEEDQPEQESPERSSQSTCA